MRKFVSYYRVNARGDTQTSLENQKRIVDKLIATQSGTEIGSFVEFMGSANFDRPELEKAMSQAKAESATLVVASLDRLTRSATYLEELLATGVEIVSGNNQNIKPDILPIIAGAAFEKEEKMYCEEYEYIKGTVDCGKLSLRYKVKGCPTPGRDTFDEDVSDYTLDEIKGVIKNLLDVEEDQCHLIEVEYA